MPNKDSVYLKAYHMISCNYIDFIEGEVNRSASCPKKNEHLVFLSFFRSSSVKLFVKIILYLKNNKVNSLFFSYL